MKSTLMIVLCSIAIFSSGCATSHTHGSALEYKVLTGNYYAKDMEKKLDDLASEGWTLVTISTSPGDGPTAVPYSYIVLKRAKR
jgi:hypothetical protein